MKAKMSFKRAALPVIATLLTAVISLTGVTYAWFTAGTTATVDQINIEVQAADGLQIATNTNNGFSWGSQYTAVDAYQKLEFHPMSGSVNDGQIVLYKATLDDNYDKITGFTQADITKNGNYISLDLYFRNISTSAKVININGTSVFSPTGGDSHTAARIAFVKQSSVTGSAASYNLNDFIEGSFVTGDSQGTVDIYEPNKTDHSASGATDYKKYNGTDTGAFEYKAVVGEGVTGAYYNRYTGDYYVKATTERTDGTYVAPGVNTNASISGGNLAETAEGKYYLASSAQNGETFAAWNKDVDYVKITAENAVNQVAERAIYIKTVNESTTTYTLVTNGASIVSGNDYYVCKPVDVFTKTAYDAEDSAMQTVETKGDATTDEYFTLAPNTVTKVTVVIWLEGQDADCNNSTAGRPFSVALKFNAVNKENN